MEQDERQSVLVVYTCGHMERLQLLPEAFAYYTQVGGETYTPKHGTLCTDCAIRDYSDIAHLTRDILSLKETVYYTDWGAYATALHAHATVKVAQQLEHIERRLGEIADALSQLHT